jgi:hypothetical protein
MRVNTAKSIALGERVHKEFGSWAEARKTAVLRDGVYVLRSKTAADDAAPGQDDQPESANRS